MSLKTFSQRIRSLGKLSPSEARVADFLESNYPLTAFETIASVSQKAGVGKATVSRFLQRLGYSGFTEFMDEIRKDVVQRLETPIDRLSERKDQLRGVGADYLSQHIEYAFKNLEETRNRIDTDQFREAARMLATCKGTVYVMGAATSQSLAQFFYLLAKYVRGDVFLLDANIGNMMHHRFSSQTVKVSRWFKRIGAPVILLADKESTPISDIVDIQLFARSECPPLFHSRVATLLVLEALLVAMIPYLEEQVFERFQVFEELREEFGVFAAWPVDRNGKDIASDQRYQEFMKLGNNINKIGLPDDED
jgi:DNA-binding MurR/RpiR family transcriptional regulator